MSSLLPQAERLAQEDGQNRPGAEYLLLASLELEDPSARRAFEAVGADPLSYREAINRSHADALESVGIEVGDIASDLPEPASPPRSVLQSEPSLQGAFKKVVDRVRAERSQIYGAYIVESVAEAEHGTAIRALRTMGVDPQRLVAAARNEIDKLNDAS